MKLFSPDNAHWYRRNGEAMHSVLSAKGEPRPTRLGDARKLGLLPSVTNILGVVAKPDLVDWKMEQAVLASLTLPRREGESLDAFARRAVEDSKGGGRSAAQFGTAFHAGAVLVAKSIEVDPAGPCAAWLDHYRAWFQANCLRLVWTEQVLVNAEAGYAGTADLLMEHRAYGLTLVDLKTQQVKGPGGRPPKARAYPSWGYQLAAYRRAIGEKVACMNLIVNSVEPGPPIEHLWSQEELERAWKVFEAAQVIWRTEKGYDPREKPKAEIEKAEGPGGRAPGEGIADRPSPIANECAAAVAGI